MRFTLSKEEYLTQINWRFHFCKSRRASSSKKYYIFFPNTILSPILFFAVLLSTKYFGPHLTLSCTPLIYVTIGKICMFCGCECGRWISDFCIRICIRKTFRLLHRQLFTCVCVGYNPARNCITEDTPLDVLQYHSITLLKFW